jgi:hypothetical protein
MDLVGVPGRSTALARELMRLGAQFVVVGGTARWLRGDPRPPRDLDIVVTDDEVPDLVTALNHIGVDVTAQRMARCRTVSLATAFGPLDVFVAQKPASQPRDGLAVLND